MILSHRTILLSQAQAYIVSTIHTDLALFHIRAEPVEASRTGDGHAV